MRLSFPCRSACAAVSVAAASLVLAPAAHAQEVPFEGAYAGPLVGVLEHHFYLELTDEQTGATDGGYTRDWDIGGGAMAGYDLAVSDRVRIGAEVSLLKGGGSPEIYLNGGRYQQNERFGYRATLRAGVVAADRALFFVKGGFGGDRYAIDNSAGVEDAREWRTSFVVGAGAQVRLDERIDLRFEYEHLDSSAHAFFVGLPIRF
ncbi:outer membrane beta-barrel protein [Citromicrobium bathyomarinum]